jgi:pyruvate/2-oxoglutarate dehydrogenase complex dihydrolipoamide dehydrogenase (E3) component
VTVSTYPDNDGTADGAEGPGRTVELSYRDLVLSTGSEPVAPPIEGLSDIPAWTSAGALSSPDLPRRLVVLGGGSAGCELAQIYAAFGSQVTLVEAEGVLLPAEASFAGEILAEALRRTGVDVRLGSAAVKAERTDDGLTLILADGARIEADRVLLATGRRPRISGLGLDSLGVDLKPGTAIPVDTTCRVVTKGSDGDTAGLWAAGDVTGLGTHTHTARYQAGVVAANILGQRREADYRAIPRAIYTMPAVFAVGASPQGAAETGVELVTAGADLAGTARALVAGEDAGRVELYAHPESKVLLGAAAVGPNAPDWMGEVTVAIRAGVPLPVLADTVHAFPTYSEALEPVLRELAGKLASQPGDNGPRRERPGPAPAVPESSAPAASLPGPGEDRRDVPADAMASDAGTRRAAMAEPRAAADTDARSAAS